MAVRRIDHDDIGAAAHQFGNPFMAIRGEADRGADAQTP